MIKNSEERKPVEDSEIKDRDKASENLKILIVEDEANMRKSTVRLIKRKMPAAKVIYAENGIDASSKLENFIPDLILVDIMMPWMHGERFIRYVRNTDRYSKTRIIAITGLSEDDLRVDAVKDAGADRVVYKPWEDEELVSAIKQTFIGSSS